MNVEIAIFVRVRKPKSDTGLMDAFRWNQIATIIVERSKRSLYKFREKLAEDNYLTFSFKQNGNIKNKRIQITPKMSVFIRTDLTFRRVI